MNNKRNSLVQIIGMGLFLLMGCNNQTKPVAISVQASPQPSPVASVSTGDRQTAMKLRQQGLQLRQALRYDEAITALAQAGKLDPQNLPGLVLWGWTAHLAGQETEAVRVLQLALIQDPNHVPALNALGIVYLVEGNLPAAVSTHQQAIAIQPDNEIAHYNLVLAHHRLKQYEDAIHHGKKATALEAQNPHPWVALALVYWAQGDKPLARKTYDNALQLDARYRSPDYLAHLKEAGFSPEQITSVTEMASSR